MKEQFPEVFALDPKAKLQLLEELWDDLSADPENVPIPAWQLEELRQREEEYKQNPTIGMSWEQVKKMILGDHG